jgi:hypothetical protein
LIQPLGKFNVSLVWRHTEARVQIAIDLIANRGENRLSPMSGIHATDTACEIEKYVAIYIFHQCAFRPGSEHRSGVKYSPRHSLGTPLHQFL